jgi:hypothetical protein
LDAASHARRNYYAMSRELIEMQQPASSDAAASPGELVRPKSGRRARGLVFPAVSLALVAPCFWHSRIQAADLGSHAYNAWLAQLVERGQAPGLALVSQNTNIVFDFMLDKLMRLFGAAAAQSIAVAFAVLILAWGSFAFASAHSGRPAWGMTPLFAMLAYGTVFRTGFFNFYIALGLSFWALALLAKPSRSRVIGAGVILAAAWAAHALPVVWCVCLSAYYFSVRGRSRRTKALAVALVLFGMFAVRYFAMAKLHGRWYPTQVISMTGADQLWFWDGKYVPLMVALMALWFAIFMQARRDGTVRRLFTGMPGQFATFTAASIIILPTSVLLPGYLFSLGYIAERMSLAVAICLCVALSAVNLGRPMKVAMAALAVLFFGLVWKDEGALNRFEDRLQAALATVPYGQRVAAPADYPDLRVNALAHMIDRACIGKCYSFGNYEPSTAQFRVRAIAENTIVTARYADSYALQTGTYRVKPSDAPLYVLRADSSGQLILKPLAAGEVCGVTKWKML